MHTQSVSPNSGVIRQSLPCTDVILKPNVAAQMARAQASSTQYYKTNMLQRMLVQMTDWVKSRVATFRIASALAPFVRNAAGKATGTVTVDQVKALNNALASAQSVKNGSDEVISVAVSQALGTLDRMEKAALREQLVSETRLSERVRDGLLVAVTASLQDSISADADFFVLQALHALAMVVEEPYSVELAVKNVRPFINEHLNVVSPGKKSAYQAAGVLTLQRQIACLSTTTKSKVRSWFNAQPDGLKRKLAAAIKQIVGDRLLQAANAPESAKRTHAFCIWLQQALV